MDGTKPNKSEVKVNLPSSSHSDIPNTQIFIPPFVPQMISSNFKLGKQKTMGSSVSEELINELSNKLGNLKVNKNVNLITDGESEDVINKIRSFKTTTQKAMMRNYYPKPTYADL
jgi:TolB-like protein